MGSKSLLERCERKEGIQLLDVASLPATVMVSRSGPSPSLYRVIERSLLFFHISVASDLSFTIFIVWDFQVTARVWIGVDLLLQKRKVSCLKADWITDLRLFWRTRN